MMAMEDKGQEISEEAMRTGIMDRILLGVYVDGEDLKEIIPLYTEAMKDDTRPGDM